jgi:hypothetical protein
MIVIAKDETAYAELCSMPLSLPLGKLQVDLDEDTVATSDLARLCVPFPSTETETK